MFGTEAGGAAPGPKEILLPSAEDFNLAAFLVTNGITKGAVIATLSAGEVIGGTVDGGYAFTAGDLTAYSSVVLNVLGTIEGKGGYAAYMNGSHGLTSDGPITINSPENIKAGGGAGGDGGEGASGSSFTNTITKTYVKDTFMWVRTSAPGVNNCYPTDVYNLNTSCYYDGQTIDNGFLGTPCGFTALYVPSRAQMYTQGTGRGTEVLDALAGTACDVHDIIQKDILWGVSTAGTGGKGQGYEGPAELGVAGSSTNRAGVGGKGGEGGAWGTVGETGQTGLGGISYRQETPSQDGRGNIFRATLEVATTDVTVGSPGGAAGIAITAP